MERKKDDELYIDAIKAWGKLSQVEMMLEELQELGLAIQKFKRNPTSNTAFDVEDEMADVSIMLAQLRMVFNPKVIDARKEYKLARLQDRLAGVIDKRHTLDEKILQSLYDTD